ncbi:MAG: hypothetical protein AABW59_05180 [archaeon]
MIFSIDAMIAFTITMLFVLGFLFYISNATKESVSQSEHFYLEEKTLLLADSLVKNANIENSSLGACVMDFEKNRVKSNYLSALALLNFKPVEKERFFLKSIETAGTKAFSSDKIGKECIAVKRFVLFEGVKQTVTVTGCIE